MNHYFVQRCDDGKWWGRVINGCACADSGPAEVAGLRGENEAKRANKDFGHRIYEATPEMRRKLWGSLTPPWERNNKDERLLLC